MVLAGWELQSKKWFVLKLGPSQVPYFFKPQGGSQWASSSAELLATLAALHAFGWLQHSRDRKTLDVVLSAGTDNLANEALSVKRSTTRWPLMAVNMQLSSSLARARLTLALKWRPREENVEADQLTNEVYTGFDQGNQVEFALEDLDLSILNALVATRAEFDEARNAAKEAARKLPSQNKKKVDKSPW